MRGTGILVCLGMALAMGSAPGAELRGSSLVLGTCNRGIQDNPTYSACIMNEMERLTPVVACYVQETRRGLRATAADAAATGSPYEAASYSEAAEQLDVAQALWVAFREAHCAMQAKQVTGSLTKAAFAVL